MQIDSDTLFIFTHIPKTSGTSLIKELAEPNLGSTKIARIGSFQRLMRGCKEDFNFISGHFPYGVHHFTHRDVKYITFLRDPIDRAVSFYYFVQQDGDNPKTRHPLCDYAESVSLKDFYLDKQFHNLQTRYTAGLLFHKSYTFLDSLGLENKVLERAISNLRNRYFFFGFLEEREESLQTLARKLKWNKGVKVSPQKKTRLRVKVNDLDNETLQVLKFANRLDQKLYDFAFSISELSDNSYKGLYS